MLKRLTLASTFQIAALCSAIGFSWASIARARESWPVAPDDVKARLDTYAKHEADLVAKLKPELAAWDKKGKPYIPWAAKPDDLPQAQIPAFPGAEGGGMFSFGGRGGKVYVITSLEDSGPGTLREACEAAGPRIVVFNVAGIIHLKMPIFIEAPYITIAGQTAPGDGICIADQGLVDNAHDVVIRYLRLRRGITDIFNRHGVHSGSPIGNIILDHLSASWGNDQNLDTYRHMYTPPEGGAAQKLPTVNVTIQWCISSEGLNTYNHAFGGDWGGRNTGFHHNLLACNTGRNPSIAMSYDFNFVNNVLFNWRHRTVDGGDDHSLINMINNYYKPGPATPDTPIRHRIVQPSQSWNKADQTGKWGKVYVAGNYVDGDAKVTADNWNDGVQFNLAPEQDATGAIAKGLVTDPAQIAGLVTTVRADKPFPMPPMTVQSAQDAYQAVLANAGATLPHRDAVDDRIITEVKTGITWGMGQDIPIDPMPGLAKNNIGKAGDGIITDISQVGGYPKYAGEPYKYSQNDGIPDWWKKKYNLDLNDPDLAGKDCNGDGYTNIEKYLDGIDPSKKVDWKDLKNNKDTLADTAATQPSAEQLNSAGSRADSVVKNLKIDDPAKAGRVHDILVKQLLYIRKWHEDNDERIKSLGKGSEVDQLEADRHATHAAFEAQLSAELTPDQMEIVKEKLTGGQMMATYTNYPEIVPNLSDAEKAKILEILKEGREEAMDSGNRKERVAIFKKYKGQINNYLNANGHNVGQAYKDWGAAQNAKKAAATAPATEAGN